MLHIKLKLHRVFVKVISCVMFSLPLFDNCVDVFANGKITLQFKMKHQSQQRISTMTDIHMANSPSKFLTIKFS